MLSVVIATDESERALVPTLAALVSGAAAGAVREVIIADAGSRDQTAEVADVAGCEVIVSAAPLAERLQQAVRAARSPWLLFLRPGVVLDPGWVEEVMRFTEHADRSARGSIAAVFRPAPAMGAALSVWGEALALLRLALRGKAKPDQGLIIARQAYDRIGGHRANAADPEADLLRRLGRRRIVLLRTGAIAPGAR
jgi:glycosyltransferase involved in cell wall biosynthesis